MADSIRRTVAEVMSLMWMGFNQVFGFFATGIEKTGWEIRKTTAWTSLENTFPGIGKEFMPSLDEGAYLLMPTSMPHAGIALLLIEKDLLPIRLLVVLLK